MSGRRRRQFDKIEKDDESSQLERKGDSRKCLLILLAVGVVVFMAISTKGGTSRANPLKPKNNPTSDKPHSANHEGGKKEDEAVHDASKTTPTQATQITGANGNKYNLLRQYIRGGIYYTQGFKHISGNKFLESGGLYGKSTIQYLTVELSEETPELYSNVDQKTQVHIDKKYFAEGCDVFRDRNGNEVIYQLTWKKRKIFKYNMNLDLIGEIELPQPIKEGWGLAVDEKDQKIGYVSDGTSIVYKVNTAFYEKKSGKETQQFKIIDKFVVQDSKERNQSNINELEFVNGYLWANQYLTNFVLKIDVTTGKVIKSYDMTYLKDLASVYATNHRGKKLSYGEVLNGIGYNKQYKIFYLTGKDWPLIFEIEFLD